MRRLLAIIVLGCALLAGRLGWADSVRTDANIVTGLDLSGSIEPRDARVQIDGIAMAIRSPQIIAAIRQGNHGRIGFALFVWADGNFPVLATWRLIGSAEEALSVSLEISEQLNAIVGSNVVVKLGALTDVSGAIDYGAMMLQTAPFETDRRIINIIGNGFDNVTESAWPARDRTIYDYVKREVIGGPDAFVLSANDPEHLVEVLARKFMTEIVLTTTPVDQAQR